MLTIFLFACSQYNNDIEANKAANKPVLSDLKKAAVNTMAAIAIGSSVLSSPVPADAVDMSIFPSTNVVVPAQATDMSIFSSTNVVAEKVTREGLYGDYTVDIQQEYDDARSTFKSAKETKKKKGQ